MRLVKILLIPAALAFAPAASFAAPAPSGNVPDELRTGIDTTPAYHRGYYHYGYGPYHYRPYRHYYGPRYYYGPRCRWSYRWQRTICRY